jgi:predicted phage terminase large subunit-like protein
VPATDIPNSCTWVRYWDLAATKPTPTSDPDYTAGVLLAYHHRSGVFFVRNVMRLQASAHKVEQRIRQTAEHDGRDVAIHFEEEPGSAGKTVTDHYSRHILPEFTVGSTRPTGSKLHRARPLSARAERGDIQLVEAHWNEALLAELEAFPDGTHDDQVDALAGAYTRLTQNHNDNFDLTGLININMDLTRTSPWDFESPDAGYKPRSTPYWRQF